MEVRLVKHKQLFETQMQLVRKGVGVVRFYSNQFECSLVESERIRFE